MIIVNGFYNFIFRNFLIIYTLNFIGGDLNVTFCNYVIDFFFHCKWTGYESFVCMYVCVISYGDTIIMKGSSPCLIQSFLPFDYHYCL